jgi:hypothetical protein
MKIAFGFAYIPLYFIWLGWHLFIKKDMARHKTDLYALSFLIATWSLIYYWIFFKEVNSFIAAL